LVSSTTTTHKSLLKIALNSLNTYFLIDNIVSKVLCICQEDKLLQYLFNILFETHSYNVLKWNYRNNASDDIFSNFT